MGNSGQRARDDFSPKVKQLLAERVNFHCSLCDATTLGPKAGTIDKRFSVGKAAHIKAAAKGGPRYDENQTPTERAGIENGLWACATCGDIIDRDDGSYTVEELNRIKADAEWLATSRAGKPPGSDLPALKTSSAIQRAVEVFCRQEAARKERLDPRFKVKVHMTATGATYEVTAKEPVEGRLVVDAKDKDRHVRLLRDFFNYGGSQAFDGADIRLEGSQLFQTGDVSATRWQLSSTPRPITMTVELEAAPTASLFVEFSGTGTQGNRGVRLKGAAFGGIVTATLTADHVGNHSDFRLDFDLQQWAQKPVRQLPHFARLLQLLQVLASPTQVHIQCTHDGIESHCGSGILDGSEMFSSLRSLLEEVELLRKLDIFFDLNLALPADLTEVMRSQCDMSGLLAMIDLAAVGETEIVMSAVPPFGDMSLSAIVEKQVTEPITLNHRIDIDIHGRSFGSFDVAVSCPAATVHVIGPANLAADTPVELVMRAAEGHHWTSSVVG